MHQITSAARLLEETVLLGAFGVLRAALSAREHMHYFAWCDASAASVSKWTSTPKKARVRARC